MKTAVIYARYSSERQTEQSIEGQLRECMAYAEHHDMMVVDTYIDRAMIGTNDNRNDFQRMLKDAQKKAWDVVLVYKLDRFSRNKYEMAIHKKTLKDYGISLVFAKEHIPEGPEGIILESLLEGMAEYYSAELAQKVSRGLRETRIKGNYAGGGITHADIKKFIRKALKKEPRLMIKLLVKEVILYDDKVEIYYNCIDKKGPDDLDHQVFCVYRQDCEVDPKELGFRHNVMGCKLALEMYF